MFRVDCVIANEEDVQKCLGIEAEGVGFSADHLSIDSYERLAEQVNERYADISGLVMTMREGISADRNGWSVDLDALNGFHASRKYHIDGIIDRVGDGGGFNVGLIHGVLNNMDSKEALGVAVAASALKNSLPVVFNLTGLTEVKNLWAEAISIVTSDKQIKQ
ncbi:hypothetical protein SAMN05920897_12710 [Alkalispirochaeta americana]|uniref:Uncharacterized protein n=1 Tax=Alkalispirochaeta americana TaxID=159291 RepID=A0A1N6XMM0_9SPIO|nr:hypothetical protein [Alkalispirochaeta americana]SIR03461.1 hypothetical protein SAMN05920897_12710 [Alkalispirochaeta americana]